MNEPWEEDRWSAEDDWEEDEWSEDHWDDDEAETIPCPACGEEVYEDADHCPYCGEYIVHSGSGYVWKERPVWWIVLGILGILAVIWGLTMQF